jgi:hypothetical protein
MTDNRLVKLATLWRRTRAKSGKTYFSGFMGDCQLVMFEGGEQPHPTRADETVHVWKLMVQERDPSRRPQQRQSRTDSAIEAQAPDGWRR